jgi:hypothetical protein
VALSDEHTGIRKAKIQNEVKEIRKNKEQNGQN